MATERLVTASLPPLLTPLHSLVFGGSLLVYNTHRILLRRFPSGNNSVAKKSRFRTWYFIFFGVGLALVVGSLKWLSWRLLVVCALPGIFAFMYSLPLLPLKSKKRLRDYGWLKILVLSGVWTIVTSVIPILYLGKNIGDYPFEIAVRLAFIFTLCIVFDIRDVQKDIENKIYTLPNKVGLKNSYLLINVMLILFAALSVIQYIRYHDAGRVAGALLTAVITRLVVNYLRKYPSDRAYLGLGDGVMLVYALLVMAPHI